MSDHDEIGTPAWEARVLRRQAELDPGAAEDLRRRADELDPPADEAGGVIPFLGAPFQAQRGPVVPPAMGTDAYEAAVYRSAADECDDPGKAAAWLLRADQLDPPDSAETVATTASVFGTLRNLADTEPVLAVGVGINMCGLCEVAHGGPAPFPHAPTCAWVAARRIVGAPADAG
jgi:hypothetical protein